MIHRHILSRIYIRHGTNNWDDNRKRYKQSFRPVGWICKECHKTLTEEVMPTTIRNREIIEK